jgi:hypothetical protein
MVILAIGGVLIAAAGAPGDSPGTAKVKFNMADQAAARAAVLRLADLGPSGWKGGNVKPDLSPGPICANYRPKQSDLVLTGVAESSFYGAFNAFSGARVLRTVQMRRDWLAKIRFPRIAEHVFALRGVGQVTDQGTTLVLTSEFVRIAKGRTEIMLTTMMPGSPYPAEPGLTRNTLRLARILVSRAHA